MDKPIYKNGVELTGCEPEFIETNKYASFEDGELVIKEHKTMQVFIVEGHTNYEGFEILGVYEFSKDAEAKMAEVLEDQKKAAYYGYDNIEISGHTVMYRGNNND